MAMKNSPLKLDKHFFTFPVKQVLRSILKRQLKPMIFNHGSTLLKKAAICGKG